MAHSVFLPKETLKPWLYKQIQSQKYEGLYWDDEHKLMFRLPWVTESDPDWQKYYKLFHDWGERDGKQPSDPQKAKRNFRSALNHSKHFQHMDKLSQEKQTGSYKVYKFLTDQEVAAQKGMKLRNTSHDSQESNVTVSPDSNNFDGYGYDQSAAGTNMVNLAATGPGYYMHDPANELNNLNAAPYYDVHNNHQSSQLSHMNIPNDCNDGISYVQNDYPQQVQQQTASNILPVTEGCSDVDMTSIPSMDSEQCNSIYLEKLKSINVTEADLTTCRYTIAYNEVNQVCDDMMAMDEGCKIIYGDREAITKLENLNVERKSPWIPSRIVQLPPQSSWPNLNIILENVDTGILFWFDKSDMCIYMLRHCLAQVFYFNVHEQSEKPIKVDRHKKYKLFSYREFLNCVSVERPLDLREEEIASLPISSNIEIVVGFEPKHKLRTKVIRISLQPIGATKISACEDLSSFHDVCISAKESSLDEQFRDKMTL